MYELYYYPGNANLAPHMVLEEIGAPFQLHFVDRAQNAHKSLDYLKLNPRGLIPVLVHGDVVLHETAAICLYLSDGHPEAGLAPTFGTPERGVFYKWLFFLANSIHPDIMPYYHPERFTSDPQGVAAVKASTEARLGGLFDLIDKHLATGPYMLGEAFSLLDLYLWMLVRWGRLMQRPPRSLNNVARWLALVTERPAVQRALATEGIVDPLY
jgi:glutathione S-transferase